MDIQLEGMSYLRNIDKVKVQIVLPIYNGENYILEQINSILNQTYSELSLLIRDDVSSDNSVSIIKNHFSYDGRVNLIEGKSNLGVIESFFYLLKNSNDSDFYALSDQDDVWKTIKIERAIENLNKYELNIPLLYCAAVDVVDENLNYKGSLSKRDKDPSFENAIVQNIATGCTIVMNKAARDLIVANKVDYKNVVMHDWWFYLVISTFGKVIFDQESVMYYRQHSNNTFGSGYSPIQRWIPRIKRFFKKQEAGTATRQVQEFYNLYKNELSLEQKIIVEDYLNSRDNFLKRLKFSLSRKVYRQNFFEDIVCHILLIFNKW